MLKTLFGGRATADAADAAHHHHGTAQHDTATAGDERPAGASWLLLSLPGPVELRELSGSLDRQLTRGSLRIYGAVPTSSAGPWALGYLRVGSTDVAIGQIGRPAQEQYRRIDERTFKIVPAHSLAGGDGNGNGNSNFGGGEFSLLLIFPHGAASQDVSRTEAVLADLAIGRGGSGAAEPAGATHYHNTQHPPTIASTTTTATAGAAPSAASSGLLQPTDDSLVLFHDPDPARNMGWRNGQPVRLTHLERTPPARRSTGQRGLGQRAVAATGGDGGAAGGGAVAGGAGSAGSGGLAGSMGSPQQGRSLLGPNGAEVGSPGGTRSGRLRGLGLGGVWGSVSVANLAYEKVSANWDKRLGRGADNFKFAVDLDAAAASNGVALRSTLAAGNHVTLSLAVHYVVARQEHWDNNDGANYTFDLPCE
ncbi:hypothetical protein GPECTOR_30g264 [Gonium pectorale]|uniref:CBM21 domain-containing protein n=1 Tax=Gonium pectorale TaxID=33097 RepID=A0A150GEC9_GONPE|nr:hypothetical protein GPECTOR_30g264 [Gonium pectorale]|eukprot:KXZ48168.1 hypothetical protein GPECTOR_30g264 [Gonium pectorale]